MSYTLQVHLSLKSSNAKTGPIPVSTSTSATCPSACPFIGQGCYAQSGPLAMHWGKVSANDRGADWATFCDSIAALPQGQIWRHNQAGDLPGADNAIDAKALSQLVRANRGKRGFTYTHKPTNRAANRRAIAKANAAGFTVNLSANNPAHADTLAELDIGPVVTVLPAAVNGAETKTLQTPAGRTITVCPATYRDDVTCQSCGLCQRIQNRAIVGFPAHGSQSKRASAIASK